jgi:hypothetical protein
VVYAAIKFLVCSIITIEENRDKILEAIMDAGLEISAWKTKYMIMSSHPNSGQNKNIRKANESFGNVTEFKYLGMTLIRMTFMMKSRAD